VTDLSNLRTPAWRRVVEDLSADAPNAPAFLGRLCAVLTRVAGARQGSVVLVPADADGGEHEPEIAFAVAARSRSADPERIDPERVEQATWVRAAAVEASRNAEARVFALSAARRDGPMYGESGEESAGDGGAVLAGPVELTLDGTRRAVVCLTLEPRSREAVQTTMALVEVLCGYARLHTARQEARGAWQASASLDLAGRLIASINEAPGFKGACLQMVNDLARAADADRAAIGWVRGVGDSGAVRVAALSDTEHIDRRLRMVRQIEAAMEECYDQGHAVAYPPTGPQADTAQDADDDQHSDPTLAGAITHAHRELVAADTRLRVASLPVRAGERVVGVVTIETADEQGVSPARLELLQASLDLVGPVLELRRSDDRPLPVRTWHAGLRAGAWAVGPRHTAWKLAALVALAVVLAVTFVRIPYRIDAPAELVAVNERVVAAPFAGVIARVPENIRPGVAVQKGQVLLELDTTELRESLIDATSAVAAARREADEARKEGDLNTASQALARLEREQARQRFLQLQLDRAIVRAPIAGTIVTGDVRRRVGSAIELGESLFRVARLDELEVVARVPDRDIGYVSERSFGSFATRARPGERFDLQAHALVPLGQPEEGENAFELRATLESPPAWLRPGMEGIAYLDTRDERIIWILTRRLVDTARLWLWY